MIDVCVIGGGPAGAIAALELRRLGYSTKLIFLPSKRNSWPEVISPRLFMMLHQLGIASALSRSVHVEIDEKRINWRSNKDPERLSGPGGTIIDREQFDRALVTAATSAGVDLVDAAAGFPLRQPDGNWQIPLGANGRTKMSARFVVLATGRRNFRFGDTVIQGTRRIALHGFARNSEMPPGTMVVGNTDTHWHWGVSLPGGIYHVLAFVPAGRLSEAPIALLERSLPQEVKDRPLTFNGAADATSRAAREPAGQGWIRVGDAFLATDPLSSNGLYVAVLTAVQSARIINTILKRPMDAASAVAFYKNVQQEMISHFASTTASFYDPEPNGTLAVGEFPSNSRKFFPALDDLVLSPSIQMRPVPTIAGDLVTTVSGLVRPNRSPVAFIDGIPISWLLAPLQAGKSVAAAVGDWTNLPIHSRARVVQFLVDNAFVIERGTNR